MPALSEDQARTLANEFLQSAAAISDFRSREFATLTPEGVLALKSLELKLSNQSDDMTATAIQDTLDNLDQTVKRITKTTTAARAAIATLQDIGKAVTIGASLIALGTAIAAGNPGGILTAIQNTNDAISS